MAHFLKLPLTSPDEPDIPTGACNLDHILAEQVQIKPEDRLVFYTSPHTPGADRIRYLRMHLRNMREAKGVKTVLITSPMPGDGKTTLSLNLATALAEEGKNRVLLVEADLHHAPLAQRLGFAERGEGLVECLQCGVHPVFAIRRLDPLGWYLLPAGKAREHPADLLQSGTYGSMVKSLSESFDWILVDSPPVIAMSDALYLRQHTDATILVVRAGQTPQSAVDESIRQIGRQHIAAIVLNAVEGLDRMYYKYGSPYYRSESANKS